MKQSPWQLPESFFENLATQEWAVVDSALELSAAETIRSQGFKDSQLFHAAGVGRAKLDNSIPIKQEVRSDHIRWITPQDESWRCVQLLKEILATEMRVHLLDFEAHLTKYLYGGSYELHIDQFSDRFNGQFSDRFNGQFMDSLVNQSALLVPKRIFSFILYLNQNWQPGDGGELLIFSKDNELQCKVEPIFNRLVVFQSATIPHAVSATIKPRYSLTGWMRK